MAEKITRKAGESAGDYAKRIAAAKKAEVKAGASQESMAFDGIVVEVSSTIGKKSNGSRFQTAGVLVEKDGKKITVAAFRTILKVQDADGNPLDEPIESEPVQEGDKVKIYGRLVDGKPYFDISAGGVETSDEKEVLSLFK